MASTVRHAWRTGGVLVLALLLLGVVGTIGLARNLVDMRRAYAARLMDDYAHAVSGILEDEMSHYVEAVRYVATAISAQSECTASDFTGITAGLSGTRLPGADRIQFVVPATDAEVPAVEAIYRARGVPDLRLNPVSVGIEHKFVVFNRNILGSPDLLGSDLSQMSEPENAMLAARGDRMPSASQTYVPVHAKLPSVTPHLLFDLAAPVFGGEDKPDQGVFRGWVLMRVRAADAVASALRERVRGAVSVEVVELTSLGATNVIGSVADGDRRGADPLTKRRSVLVAGRSWEIDLRPTEDLLSATDRNIGNVTLGIGLLFTLLLASLVAALVGSRSRALREVDAATGALRDDIERRKATEGLLRQREAELRYIAFHDPLTGLANRALFRELAERAIAGSRQDGASLVLYFIDLDQFKEINDRLGHKAGDEVLTQTASRLRQSVRGGDTIARLGGDEFAVLARAINGTRQSRTIANRILRALSQPYQIDGQSVTVTGSVGIAQLRHDMASLDDLLRASDNAMYAAKAAGRSRYAMAGFEPGFGGYGGLEGGEDFCGHHGDGEWPPPNATSAQPSPERRMGEGAGIS